MDTNITATRIMSILGSDKADQIRKALPIPKTVELRDLYLQPKLDAATTVEECRYVCCRTTGELRRKALEKALSLATTVEECQYVYGRASGELKQKAWEKALSLATTVEQYKALFDITGRHSPEAYRCIQALAAFLEKAST